VGHFTDLYGIVTRDGWLTYRCVCYSVHNRHWCTLV